MTSITDVSISNVGSSLIGFTPLTKDAIDWIDDNVETESYQWMGRTLYVEARYADDLAAGMIDAGLKVA